eukprot:gene7169-biopygen258
MGKWWEVERDGEEAGDAAELVVRRGGEQQAHRRGEGARSSPRRTPGTGGAMGLTGRGGGAARRRPMRRPRDRASQRRHEPSAWVI